MQKYACTAEITNVAGGGYFCVHHVHTQTHRHMKECRMYCDILFKNVRLAIEMTDAPDEPHQRNSNHRKHQRLECQPDDCETTIGMYHLT